MSYTEIKTFEDACAKLGHDAAKIIPDFSLFPEHHRNAMTAIAKLVIINEALNDGWQPDWSDSRQWKYYPWFDFDDSSAVGRFSFDGCVGDYSSSGVGSRLCYKTRDIAKYAGKQFEDLYKQFMTL